MRFRTTFVLSISVLLAAVAPVRADLAVFTDGRVLRVEDACLVGEEIHLRLRGGGILEIAATRIDRVVDDEVDHTSNRDGFGGACDASWRQFRLPDEIPYADLIEDAAREAKIHPRLLAALVRAESAFDPVAVSRVGARGLTQLMPSAAADHGVLDPFDPAENLRGGASHLRLMLDRFESLPLALAAYNAGAATVERYGDVPPYRETRGFLRGILEEFCKPCGD
ncbi:MAG: transglycosylase SLT domain-containing protein [Thermoanaerobaculales bacterium]|nr:transglycosylase SLT domain-containing protein [Thermoanaerobaculales bacterium]